MTETVATLTSTDFLLARIAEDEEGAREKISEDEEGWRIITRRPNKRVLAECGAKQRIVELHSGESAWCGWFQEDAWVVHGDLPPCETIRILATVYTDHPDYREEWKP